MRVGPESVRDAEAPLASDTFMYKRWCRVQRSVCRRKVCAEPSSPATNFVLHNTFDSNSSKLVVLSEAS